MCRHLVALAACLVRQNERTSPSRIEIAVARPAGVTADDPFA
jgi:hypothetical protein